MIKFINYLNKSYLSILLIFVTSNAIAYSGEYRVTTLHPLEIYQEGTVEEALALSNEWREKVLLKNPHMLAIDYLLEKQSASRYNLLVIYHYKDRDSAKKANQEIANLINKAWPDKAKQQAFFNSLQRYVVREEQVTHRYDVID